MFLVLGYLDFVNMSCHRQVKIETSRDYSVFVGAQINMPV